MDPLRPLPSDRRPAEGTDERRGRLTSPFVTALTTVDDALAYAIEVAAVEKASPMDRFELDHARTNVRKVLVRQLPEQEAE